MIKILLITLAVYTIFSIKQAASDTTKYAFYIQYYNWRLVPTVLRINPIYWMFYGLFIMFFIASGIFEHIVEALKSKGLL